MAMTSVTDFSNFINQQIGAQEQIRTCLWELEALISVALMTDFFYKFSESILHNYFFIASSLIDEATEANQLSLDSLLKQGR